MIPENQIFRKQPTVGSIVVCPIPSSSFYLATWFRISNQYRKIIKVERLLGKQISSYRCCVYDYATIIEVHFQIENCCSDSKEQKQIVVYGPVKYDPYVWKELEESRSNFTHFTIGVVGQQLQNIPCRLKANFRDTGELQIFIESKKQQFVAVTIAKIDDERIIERLLSIQNLKLTDIYVKRIANFEEVQKQIKEMGIKFQKKIGLKIRFFNAVQRNLFLAQILKRIRGRGFCLNRKQSDVHSIAQSETKNPMENQFEDLFTSKPSMKGSHLSDRIYNDFKEVVFTPQSGLTSDQYGERFDNAFDQFLNPQELKKDDHKLSDIVEQENEHIKEGEESPRKGIQSEFQKSSQSFQKFSPQNKKQSNFNEQKEEKTAKEQIHEQKKSCDEKLFFRKLKKSSKSKEEKKSVKNSIIKYNLPQSLRQIFRKEKEKSSCNVTQYKTSISQETIILNKTHRQFQKHETKWTAPPITKLQKQNSVTQQKVKLGQQPHKQHNPLIHSQKIRSHANYQIKIQYQT